jgi:hypothetical protein
MLFPSPLVGEGGAQSAPDEGSLTAHPVSAETDPSPAANALPRGWRRRSHHHAVMAGLVPAIHVLVSAAKEDVDARDKPGHDE